MSLSSLAQNSEKYTVSGHVADNANGEDLIGAQVTVLELPGVGVVVNEYGFYSLTLKEGEYTLVFRSIGYAKISEKINLTSDLTLDMKLISEDDVLGPMVVKGDTVANTLDDADGSKLTVDLGKIKELPVLIEPDPIYALTQYETSIKSAGEGNAGFYVRGGGLDQNLILLDEAPVYNPSHLLGFFSVFNSDALKDVDLFKGGMLPEYGGRTSSVMDIRMKDGNKEKLGVAGGIGLVSSRLTVEAPVNKGKGSFIVSGRRSLVDLFMGLSSDETIQQSNLFFYDLNLKANYTLGKKDRIYLSGYFGRDNFGFDNTFGLTWGNATGTVRWNHLFNNRLFSNTSFIYSNYDYKFSFGEGDDEISLESVIRDWNFKQDYSYYLNNENSLKIGYNVIHHTIEPGNLTAGANTGIEAQDATKKYSIEGAVYIQNEQKVSQRLNLGYGLRWSFFNYMGEGKKYEFDDAGNLLSEVNVGSWETIKFYHGFEPRFSSSYRLNPSSSLKLTYNRNYQYLHLLTNATTSTPTDVWINSSNNVEPQIADQVALGYHKNFKKNMFVTSAEIYYKDMQNVIDYRTGADIFLNNELEGDLVYGDGRAYGLELSIKKNQGKFTGSISYTLSRTERQFDEINDGEWFSARQDRTHDLSAVGTYNISEKLSISAAWIYYTGDAVTFPTGKYLIDGQIVPYYTERNGYRMPDFHRLDLAVNWKRRKTEKFESSWNFSLYNVYGRENAYSITFRPNEDNPTQTEAVQLSLFKWVPSVTYNFKF